MSDTREGSIGGQLPQKAEMTLARRPRPLPKLGRWGIVLTVVYCGAFLILFGPILPTLTELPLNEVGDFLAGAAAPLAFLWLVLGFFQQGVELRNSADALWLQGEELRNSVEQQRQLVEVTREQLAFEAKMLSVQQEEVVRSSLPVWRIEPRGNAGAGSNLRSHTFSLANHGRTCSDVTLLVDGTIKRRAGTLETGKWADFKIEAPIDVETTYAVRVNFIDARNVPGSSDFEIRIIGGDATVRELVQPREVS